MRYILANLLISFCLALVFAFPSSATGQTIPDFTRGEKIPAGATHDWNLGPTGARGWMHSEKLETTQARQIYVTSVDADSPAENLLQVGDVILGVAGKQFEFDPRTELGIAIGKAEASDGRLKLSVWRSNDNEQAETIPVAIELLQIGEYSATAPFDCAKSDRIFQDGCAALAESIRANPNSDNRITRSLNALALLSSGDKQYLPLVKSEVQQMADFSDPESRMLHCWYYGPVNLLLAEYTLATGDQTFLPDLKRITMEIVNGQSDVGSWGHRFARTDGRLNGYGMMNAPGLPLTVSLILARKAGVDDPRLDDAIAKSTRLIRFYVGKGCVPYGDHAPWMETHDDNGKNGIAAIMFNLLEDAEAADYFSRMSVASHGAEREMGHTGNFFNILWALPGVALSGPNASGAWMREFGWYYDLARRWDGTFTHQGPPQNKSDSYRNWDATGAFLLAYGQPLKQLYITGKQDDVVSPASRSTAESLINDGRDYSHRLKDAAYAGRDLESLFDGLESWSPVVRQRCATALSKRDGDHVSRIANLLKKDDLYSQLGACEALAAMGNRSAAAMPGLTETLDADDMWLRIKAAEAIAAIGPTGRPAIPKLLSLLAEDNPETDPRGMQQRFLCFAVFNQRNGMLGQSLDGVDRDELYAAVKAGLQNEDGRARGSIASVYRNLTFEEVEPLLPVIHKAVAEPSQSGIMFADGIRLSGLEILAKHKIENGMQLCLDVIEIDRWGQGRRFEKCVKTLQAYGGAAKELVPQLEQLKEHFARQRKPKTKEIALLDQTIDLISRDTNPPTLRALPRSN